jgi:hypothetical protein
MLRISRIEDHDRLFPCTFRASLRTVASRQRLGRFRISLTSGFAKIRLCGQPNRIPEPGPEVLAFLTSVYLLTVTSAPATVGTMDVSSSRAASAIEGRALDRPQPCRTYSSGGHRHRRRIQPDPTGDDIGLVEDLDDEIAVVAVPTPLASGTSTLTVPRFASWSESPASRLVILITGRFRC